ncbi:hypothetical protein [Halocatena marina]|uniref:hypothetical protein n=1 Tax=Halocatena marina TaxID=2934937 RepID=UPI0036F2E386
MYTTDSYYSIQEQYKDSGVHSPSGDERIAHYQTLSINVADDDPEKNEEEYEQRDKQEKPIGSAHRSHRENLSRSQWIRRLLSA